MDKRKKEEAISRNMMCAYSCYFLRVKKIIKLIRFIQFFKIKITFFSHFELYIYRIIFCKYMIWLFGYCAEKKNENIMKIEPYFHVSLMKVSTTTTKKK